MGNEYFCLFNMQLTSVTSEIHSLKPENKGSVTISCFQSFESEGGPFLIQPG